MILHCTRRLLLLSAFCALAVPRAGSAQGSPIVDLLVKARSALNDLRNLEADSLALLVLNVHEDRMNTEQRIEALSIAAASRYPEPFEGAQQYPVAALVVLRRLVQIDPEAKLRSDLSWRGLDSLLIEARRTTFAARFRPRTETTIGEGVPGSIGDGTSTRPARWRVELLPVAGGRAVYADSAPNGNSASLPVRLTVTDGRPSLGAGEFVLRVTARDTESLDSTRWTFPVEVEAAELELVALPTPLDSTSFLPEVAPRARARGIVLGLVMGGITIAGSNALRGTTDLGEAAGADSRAMVLGGALAIGSITAGFLDRGTPLPHNAESNRRRRADYASELQAAEVENQRRVNAHRVTLRIVEQP